MGFVVWFYTRSMTKALRGINLGGWLVAERWMTPGLFQEVENEGEIALVRELGYEKARARLDKHRGSFITEKDFAWIVKHGFDFVRLPVGYWLFSKTDDFIDGEIYVKSAFDWAGRYGLKVILDFHGLQGSQNGQDHSGQTGKIGLYRRSNREEALNTFAYMCRTYGKNENLIGIELINEPKAGLLLWRLMRYYDRAVAIAERYLLPATMIIVSDAYKPLRMARAISRRDYGSRVVLDVHLYQLFTKRDQSLSFEEHIQVVDTRWRELLRKLNDHVSVFVGEWSAALPGRVDDQSKLVEYFKAQQELFDNNAWAHSYWSYKVPGGGPWDMRSHVEFYDSNR